MKICYLADINSAHTKKWCNYFLATGNEVHVISLHNGELEGIKVHSLEIDTSLAKVEKSHRKLGYLNKIKKVREIINDIQPDILHAHYASSYGLLGALSNYHPYVVSLWGSDILLFPKEGLIQREIIKYNLRKADRVFSTSKYMMEEANNYTNKKIDITPFGIDLSIFNNRNIRKDDELVIGIVKSLEKIYGIDYLINAFSILLRKYPQYNIKLKILGEGTQKRALEKLAEDLSISKRVEFLESRDLIGVSDFYNEIHIGVFPSLSESFGVTILEAQACGVPVVVSDIKAFYESTIPGETSLICKVKDVDSIVEALENILLNKDLYISMSKKAEQFVKENFDINKIFKRIELIYEEIVKDNDNN